MCVVSMVGDHYREKWDRYREYISHPVINSFPVINLPVAPAVSKEEFDQLKREVADLRKLLERAKEYDARTGQPDCEIADKMEFLRQVAKLVGVSLDDVIGERK